MPVFFFDTSALVKRYFPETGSRWIQELFQQEDTETVISQLTLIELLSALHKKHRMGDLSVVEYQGLKKDFLYDCRDDCYELVLLDVHVVDLATLLLEKYGLRAYDAIQLSTAFYVHQNMAANGLPPITFVCSDNVLCKVAQNEGLQVKNPNDTGE